MSKLFKYLAISLAFMVIGFFVGLAFVPVELVAIANTLLLAVLVVFMIVALIMKFVKKKSRHPLRFPMWVVYLFTFIDGILTYPVLMYYLQSLGTIIFMNIILSVLIIFGILSYVASKQKSGSYVKLGRVLGIALVVLIVMSLVNIFMQVDTMSILISAAGVVIFSAYILVDVNQFKSAYEAGMIQEKNDYSIFVLNIYLDIINLLLDLLDLVNRLKD